MHLINIWSLIIVLLLICFLWNILLWKSILFLETENATTAKTEVEFTLANTYTAKMEYQFTKVNACTSEKGFIFYYSKHEHPQNRSPINCSKCQYLQKGIPF